MHARVTTLKGEPGSVKEATTFFEQHVLPAAEGLDGFKGYLLLGDPEGGRSLSITLWESEQAMRASEETANRLRQDAADGLTMSIVSVDRYEVTSSSV